MLVTKLLKKLNFVFKIKLSIEIIVIINICENCLSLMIFWILCSIVLLILIMIFDFFVNIKFNFFYFILVLYILFVLFSLVSWVNILTDDALAITQVAEYIFDDFAKTSNYGLSASNQNQIFQLILHQYYNND